MGGIFIARSLLGQKPTRRNGLSAKKAKYVSQGKQSRGFVKIDDNNDDDHVLDFDNDDNDGHHHHHFGQEGGDDDEDDELFDLDHEAL